MAFAYPYTVDVFIDQLLNKWTSVTFDDQRYDENPVQGTGFGIPTEMADPKWKMSMEFADLTRDESMFLETRIRKLQGARNAFMIYDPRRRYPKLDPAGTILGASNVLVASIGSDRQSMTLKGLPPAYAFSIGDKGQISFGTGRNYFFEFSEAVTANGSGVTASVEVWPYVPVSVAVDNAINLKKPACKVTIASKNMGKASSLWTSGVSLELMEHA